MGKIVFNAVVGEEMRELDAQIAELMGEYRFKGATKDETTGTWSWLGTPNGEIGGAMLLTWPRYYSTKIADTWPVVEEMYRRGFDFHLEYEHHNGRFWAHFHNGGLTDGGEGDADTAPEAICLAALEAVDG